MIDDPAPPRLAPLRPPFEPDAAEQLAKWMPPGVQAEPLALFRTLQLHGELASRMRPLGAGILGRAATVPPRLREVMIDRTCALTGAEYEWGVHAAAFAAAVGLDEEMLASTVRGSAVDPCWDRESAAVMRLADELHDSSEVSEELWRELEDLFEPVQIIELVVTAGWYHLIAYVCNALRIELEPWARRFADV
jgi:4-carboxymuconolactone decarboxylase